MQPKETERPVQVQAAMRANYTISLFQQATKWMPDRTEGIKLGGNAEKTFVPFLGDGWFSFFIFTTNLP